MKKKYFFIVIIVLIIIALFAWSKTAPGPHDVFAQCVADSGATFYGAFWCSHCEEQKTLFGTSEKLLPYVECSGGNRNVQKQVCRDANINAYPTWEFTDGSRFEEVLTFDRLSELTGCSLTNNE